MEPIAAMFSWHEKRVQMFIVCMMQCLYKCLDIRLHVVCPILGRYWTVVSYMVSYFRAAEMGGFVVP